MSLIRAEDDPGFVRDLIAAAVVAVVLTAFGVWCR